MSDRVLPAVTVERIERAIQSLEDLALRRVRQQFPGLQRKGFAAAIRAIQCTTGASSCECRESGMPGCLLANYRCGFVPDGWFVEHDSWGEIGEYSIFTCIEIEDSHPLSLDKIGKYCDLWYVLDDKNHELRLFVFDRYGLNQRELNLSEMFWAMRAQKRERAA